MSISLLLMSLRQQRNMQMIEQRAWLSQKKNPFTSVVVEVVINEKIINLDWHVDDDLGNWSRPPINYKHWCDSYEGAGSFVISGKYDISDFKIVYSNKFFPE